MDYSLLNDEDRKRWRQGILEHLRNYPEFGRFPGEAKWTQLTSCDGDVRWAAEEVIRLEAEVERLKSLLGGEADASSRLVDFYEGIVQEMRTYAKVNAQTAEWVRRIDTARDEAVQSGCQHVSPKP